MPLGQGIGDIALLVLAAALNQRAAAEHLDHRLVQRFGPVDHDQQRAVGIEPALDQVGEQGLNRRRVLGRPFAQPQHMLAATLIDPHRRQHHVLAEVHPVDHQRDQARARAGRGSSVPPACARCRRRTARSPRSC